MESRWKVVGLASWSTLCSAIWCMTLLFAEASLLSLCLANVRQRGVRLCLGNLYDVLRKSKACRKIPKKICCVLFSLFFIKKFLVLVQDQVIKSGTQNSGNSRSQSSYNTVNSLIQYFNSLFISVFLSELQSWCLI